MRRILLVLPILAALLFIGCGGGGHRAKPLPTSQNVVTPACNPTPGQGHLGVCAPHQRNLTRPITAALPSNQGLIADIYEGDTVYSFAQAKSHVVGIILKAYEYRADSTFVSRWRALQQLGIWHAAYVFLHSDCSAVDRTVALVNSVGGFNQPNTGPLIIDAETSDTAGTTGCAVARGQQLTGRVTVIYTAPGTWAGGAHGNALLWAAGYGNYSHCPFVWTANCIAWQYTDGQYGPYPHQIPGIQPGDISVSYGMQGLVAGPPPDPYAFIPHGPFADGNRLVDEYWTVKNWDKWHCQSPVLRHQCVVDREHLIFTRGRVSYLAHHVWGTPTHPNWRPNNGGLRWNTENLRINATKPTHAGQWG